MSVYSRITLLLVLIGSLVGFGVSQSQAACGDGVLQSSKLLYGADGAKGNPSNLYVLDPSTGSIVKTIGAIGFSVTGLAINPITGELFGVTSGSQTDPNRGFLIHIDETTGVGTQIGDLDPNSTKNAAADITFAPDGTLFGWIEPDTDDLAKIDLVTGLASVVGDSTLDTSGSGLATLDGSTVFLAGDGPASDLSSIDPSTGLETSAVTLNGYTGNGDEIDAMDFNSDGVLYGVAIDTDATPSPTTDLITINTTTGLITTVGPSVDKLDAIAFAEPEACDDGNTVAGDGCSSDCKTIEAGFTCAQPGQPCQPIVSCGNGTVEGSEVCDDGNTVAGDGCSSDCQVVESGFTCPPAGGPCIANGEVSGSGCSLTTVALGSPSVWFYLIAPLGFFFFRRKQS